MAFVNFAGGYATGVESLHAAGFIDHGQAAETDIPAGGHGLAGIVDSEQRVRRLEDPGPDVSGRIVLPDFGLQRKVMIIGRAVADVRRIKRGYSELNGASRGSNTVGLPSGADVEHILEPSHGPGPVVVLVAEATFRNHGEAGLLGLQLLDARVDVAEGVIAHA